ncbi:MAG: serpin family protein [Bacillota bacterium]|nr:serpin family protein [Bacillota bacterium]
MKKGFLITLMLVCMVLSACSAKSGKVAAEDESLDDPGYSSSEVTRHDPLLSEYGDLNEFCYQVFANGMDETNPVLSPVSAYIALAMVTDGAREETRTELLKVLGENYNSISGDVIATFPDKQETGQLLMANSVWFDKSTSGKISDEYVSGLEQIYEAQIYARDLATEDTQKEVNKWVSRNTNEMINEILEKPFPDDVRMALFNAVYFEGRWEKPFSERRTQKGAFTLEDGTSVETDMMKQQMVRYRYYDGEYFEGIIMPYEDSSYSFIVMLPKEGEKVRDMYEAFDMQMLGRVIDYAEYESINLQMPKFEISSEKDLIEDLQSMGVMLAFSDEADFSGITGNTGLQISQVTQKAVFAVDEEGTKAAAVTEAAAAETAVFDEEAVEFDLNRPFLYMIVEKNSCVTLFIGIMDDPTAGF